MTAAEIKRVEARHTDTHKYNHTRATPGGNCWTCKQQSKARRSQLNFDSSRQPVAARQINLFKSPLFTIVSDCAASALPTLSHCQGSVQQPPTGSFYKQINPAEVGGCRLAETPVSSLPIADAHADADCCLQSAIILNLKIYFIWIAFIIHSFIIRG